MLFFLVNGHWTWEKNAKIVLSAKEHDKLNQIKMVKVKTCTCKLSLYMSALSTKLRATDTDSITLSPYCVHMVNINICQIGILESEFRPLYLFDKNKTHFRASIKFLPPNFIYSIYKHQNKIKHTSIIILFIKNESFFISLPETKSEMTYFQKIFDTYLFDTQKTYKVA